MASSLQTLLKIPNAKKISYVFFIPVDAFSCFEQQARTIQTLTSVLKQSVPLCDLIVITPRQLFAQVKKVIDQCVKKDQKKYIQIPAAVSLSESTKAETAYRKNGSNPDPCIRLYKLPPSDIASAMSLVGAQIQTEWVVFLDNSTQVVPSATYQLTRAIIQHANSELIYADHDVADNCGARSHSVFKPTFSLDLLYSQNYIGSFFAIKTRNILNVHMPNNNYALLSYTFYLILFLIENLIKISPSNLRKLTKKITHLPFILNSVKKQTLTKIKKREGNFEQLEILRNHLFNCYENVACTAIKPFIFRHTWPIKASEPLVSLIIPTRDGHDILKACISSIIEKTTYKNYEIIIVDNQTIELKSLKYLNELVSSHNNIKIIKYSKPFNYSDINNIAVKQTKGQILGFLNNDIEVITPNWLTEMVSHAIRPDVGCVGAMHYYPDMNIQHAGVVVGMHGVADHAFKGLMKSEKNDRFGYLYSIRNPDAVTAATLLVKKDLFDLVGGFDSEHLKIAFNDVDLCLKIQQRGYRCVWTPYAEFYHYESKTRARQPAQEALEREVYEHLVMKKRWKTDKYVKRDLLIMHETL